MNAQYRTWYGGKMHKWGIFETKDGWGFIPPIDLHSPQMQNTQLKDKNGKPIYEGDIIAYDEHYGGDYRHTAWELPVIFQEGGFDLESTDKHWAEDLSFLCANNYCRVIGNIYENPDLLQKGQSDERGES